MAASSCAEIGDAVVAYATRSSLTRYVAKNYTHFAAAYSIKEERLNFHILSEPLVTSEAKALWTADVAARIESIIAKTPIGQLRLSTVECERNVPPTLNLKELEPLTVRDLWRIRAVILASTESAARNPTSGSPKLLRDDGTHVVNGDSASVPNLPEFTVGGVACGGEGTAVYGAYFTKRLLGFVDEALPHCADVFLPITPDNFVLGCDMFSSQPPFSHVVFDSSRRYFEVELINAIGLLTNALGMAEDRASAVRRMPKPLTEASVRKRLDKLKGCSPCIDSAPLPERTVP